MSNNEKYFKLTGTIRLWAITLVAILISFCGILLALMCIYSIPDGSNRAIVGSFFHICSSFTLISYFLMECRKIENFKVKLNGEANQRNIKIIINESLSAYLLKWIISIYSICFAVSSIGIALICIYGIPDGTAQPQTSILFLLSGFIVMLVLVFASWNNWSVSEK